MTLRAAAMLLYGATLLTFEAGASHITDKMAVGLYDSPDDEQPRRVLTSGTPLEILDRAGRLCEVRLGDGKSGWLECRYITDEKPARAMLVEAQARSSQLRDEINALTLQLEAEQQSNEALERRLQAVERLLTEQAPSQESPATGTEDADSATVQTNRADTPDTVSWVPRGLPRWLSVLPGAIVGFVVGALAFFWRCRKKHGGLGI